MSLHNVPEKISANYINNESTIRLGVAPVTSLHHRDNLTKLVNT